MEMYLIKYFCVTFLLVLVFGMEASIAADFNYAQALDKTFSFLEAQRSGKLPLNQRVKWRGDSGIKDGFLQGVDLVGGYYDAGDHVKFGLPMAFSVTMLAWGAIEYRKDITSLDQMGQTLSAIKWGTDYFIKAHSQPNVLWGQVGDGDSDHFCWERAEDMTTSRTAYKLDQYHPGSDLAAETAAALAASSILFKPYNSSYSDLLLIHAKQLFSFADKFRGQYDDSIRCVSEFYPSTGYSDELLWGATWLYKATGEEMYVKYVVENGFKLGGTGWSANEFSWDNKYAGLQILLSKVLFDGKSGSYSSTLNQYKAKADYFVCACLQKNDGYNIHKTPGGLLYVREWNNMQYVSATAFIVAVYSDYLSIANTKVICPDAQFQSQDLLNFAKSQADYILGKNPKSMSYLVGYGPNYPTHTHHRGSSIASVSVLRSRVGCVQGFDSWYRRSEPNPNVIHGALVGGPDEYDNFSDDRSDYQQTEPSLSATAPLLGLFSKLHSVSSPTGTKGLYTNTPSAIPYQTTSNSYQKVTPTNNVKISDIPIEFIHSITSTWKIGSMSYFRHRVVIKNKSLKPISELKIRIEELSGTLYGLSQTQQNNIYQLPQWQKVLNPGSDCTFVYVQGGPQAKISLLSYQ